MTTRRQINKELSLNIQDKKILAVLVKHIAATPLQIEVRSGLIGVDVASRLERLQKKGWVIPHPSKNGEDEDTKNIYTLSYFGRKRLQQAPPRRFERKRLQPDKSSSPIRLGLRITR
jgi:DNA-binding MarR family transcriptional regulator